MPDTAPQTMPDRYADARLFGERAANCTIAAYLDDPERADLHWRNWARNERQFREWQLAQYHPEVVP